MSVRKRQSTDRPSPEQFLAAFAPAVQEIAQWLRELVVSAVPNVSEAVYPGWRLIGYRQMDRPGGRYFCFIAPMPDHVRLGFEYGVLLSDQHGVLEGSGTQVRYVSVSSPGAIDVDALSALIAEAAMVANTRRRP
jgi:hypothetical protein